MEFLSNINHCITPTPWCSGNHFVLLPDGDCFFPRIIESIESAQHSIELEMYLVESGQVATRFFNALCEAASRKVRVRVLLDYVGSYNFNHQDQAQLRRAGVILRFYNHLHRKKKLNNLARDHRKIIIIDNNAVFIGGTGITDKFHTTDHTPARPNSALIPENKVETQEKAWRELMVEAQGPIVNDWITLFNRTWSDYKGHYGIRNWHQKIDQYRNIFFEDAAFPKDEPHARINGSRGFGSDPIKGALISQLRKAKKKAWISTAYFYPSRKLRREIKNAAIRGVDVRLLLPGPKTDHPSIRFAGQAHYSKLLKHNVRIFEYQPRFLHMKVALIDDWCSIGSCNFDRWNLRWNLEANQEIIDRNFSKQVANMLLDDFTYCQYILEGSWASRSWSQQLQELFWSTVGLFITKLFFS